MKRLPNGEFKTGNQLERLILIAALQQFKENNYAVGFNNDLATAQYMLEVLTAPSDSPSPRIVMQNERISFNEGEWAQMKIDSAVVSNLLALGNPIMGYVYSTMLAASEDLLEHLKNQLVIRS